MNLQGRNITRQMPAETPFAASFTAFRARRANQRYLIGGAG